MQLRRLMKRIVNARIVVAVLVLGTVAAPAAAQNTPSKQDSFTGVWRSKADKREKQQRLKAIEAATADMSIFIRGTARKRLGKGTAPPARMRLVVEGKRFTVARDGKSFSLQLGANPITVKKDGKQAKVSARREGATIVVESQGEKGRRVTRYALSSDGTCLTMSVRMRGKKLSGVLAFKATFRRQATAEKGR